MIDARLPSPPVSSFGLGPVTIHVYALCILAGIAVAMWWAGRRWAARGGRSEDLFDIAFVAVVAGIVGARVYHVITSPDAYFGPGGDPVAALYIWNGGLGIWGAISGGALAAWVMARRRQVPFAVLADTIAPTLLVAQALGRVGNWFNQELYGGPTTLPWGLSIPCVTNGEAILGCAPGTYHPTFLYEMLWNLVGCGVLVLLERRFHLGGGRVFWAYVAIYTSGRLWIELMRTDPAHVIAGLRVNVWTSLLMLALAIVMLVVLTRRRRRRGSEAHRVVAPAANPDGAPSSAGSHVSDGEFSESGRVE